MAEFWTEKRVLISADATTLANAVSSRLLERLAKRTLEKKTTHLALTGGAIGTEILRAAGANPARHDVDWSRVHFWWGDERLVPRDDAERNEAGARSALLDHIDVPAANVHAMAASDDGIGHDEAAAAYAAELASFGTAGQAWPEFYICFLGVGPDGHIASLFPDRAEIQLTDRTVAAVRHAPKPPADRLTLTRPVLNSSRSVWLVLSGPDKASALGLALAGATYESVPAAGAKGTKRTVFFVDEAAAAAVPQELIAQEY